MGPEGHTRVTRLANESLYLLSHLAYPILIFETDSFTEHGGHDLARLAGH